MPKDLLQKSFALLLKRQTNILSAAMVIMATTVLSQIFGLIRYRLLIAIFGYSATNGAFLAAQTIPDFLFGLIFAGALSSAFIPVFSNFLAKGREKEAYKMASTLLMLGFVLFLIVSIPLFIFTPFFLQLINLGSGFSGQLDLIVNLTRIILLSQILFVFGIFFSALLQSYNHFIIPGIAQAGFNLGTVIGIILFSSTLGIYSAAWGNVLGSVIFIMIQIPMFKKIGFSFMPSFSLKVKGVMDVVRLLWPRTLSNGIGQLGDIASVNLVSFLAFAGTNLVVLNLAKTLAFASVALFGQSLAQAAFPVLAREKDKLEQFKVTFITTFNQLLYLVLPISALLLVLRIPIVRLAYSGGKLDWPGTVLTGRTLAFLSIGIFAQALVNLAAKGFYALHDTKTPLIIGTFTTIGMIALGFVFVVQYKLGVESIAVAYSIKNIFDLLLSMVFLDKKVGGFRKRTLLISIFKISFATLFTGFALYIPIKLLDQLVFDTTRTINLIFLTGISSLAGLSLYLFLTWLFNVKEAQIFIILFKKLGNWKEILKKSDSVIEGSTMKL